MTKTSHNDRLTRLVEEHRAEEEKDELADKKLDSQKKEYEAGVAAVFGPGSNIPEAARDVLNLVRERAKE